MTIRAGMLNDILKARAVQSNVMSANGGPVAAKHAPTPSPVQPQGHGGGRLGNTNPLGL